MDNKVSIVVPIYYVEKYLNKCVKSIVDQTYIDLEIVLVDDGSTDSSPAICDEWEQRDSRIRVIHKKNEGQSKAKNIGIDYATGRYIMFADSDDWLSNSIVEKSVDRAIKDESDLVIFGYYKVDEEGQIIEENRFGNKTLSKEKMLKDLYKYVHGKAYGYEWNKLYRLSLIKESKIINDEKMNNREDYCFNLQLFPFLSTISYLDEPGYYYLQRNDSVLHSANTSDLKGINYFCEKIHSMNLGNEEQQSKIFNHSVLQYTADSIIKNIIWNNELRSAEKKQVIKKIKKELPHKDKLFLDKENPRYLRWLYHDIKHNRGKRFYYYVTVSSFYSKIRGKDF